MNATNLAVLHLADLEMMLQKIAETKKPQTPEIMNMKQLCEYVPLSASSIRNLIKNDNFPASKVEGVYLFRKIDVDIYLDKKRIGFEN